MEEQPNKAKKLRTYKQQDLGLVVIRPQDVKLFLLDNEKYKLALKLADNNETRCVDTASEEELQDVKDKLIEVESQRKAKWRQDAAVLQVEHDKLVHEIQPAKMELQQLIETYEHSASAMAYYDRQKEYATSVKWEIIHEAAANVLKPWLIMQQVRHK
jgi:hypothetical protein